MVESGFLASLNGGWIAAGVLFVALLFRDALKTGLEKAIGSAGDFVYQRLAGSRLLRRRALARYRRGLLEATEKIQVPFRPNRPLKLDSIYVALRVAADRTEKPKDVWDVLDEHPRVVVTGPPGAGKSMLLRHLAASCADPAENETSRRYLPVLLELHRLVRPAQGGESIEDYLVDAFERYGFPKADKFVQMAIEKNWLLLLLDGLDEVPTAERNAVAARVRDFLERMRSCPAVITCRSAVYHREFDAICDQQVELEPFEDQQIQSFLDSWTDPMPAGKSPAQLMAALREQPQLLVAARTPLLLTIITHLYSDNPTYVLPRSRAEFYRQAAAILLEQWQGHLGQNQFDGAEKRTILSGLALQMQEIVKDGSHDRRTISQEEALARTTELMPKLGRDSSQVSEIMREIVERSGLLLSIDGGTRYSFAHLTFQEYFAAEALLNRSDHLLEQFTLDSDTWREVIVLWCGLVTDCTAMIEGVRRIDSEVALACIAEARSVDEALAKEILDPVLESVASGEASETLQKSLGGVAADIRPRGDRVLSALVEALRKSETQVSLVSNATALSASNRMEAAEALVARVDDDEEIAACVVRMGDLAVPDLHEAALRDDSRVVCACLASIGTPDAGVALAEAMFQNPALEVPAAWGLAKVVGNPLVARRLSTHQKFRMLRFDTSLDWIWKPFAQSGDTVLPPIVGRAAELIEQTQDDADAIAVPDARISTAVCARDPNPLRIGVKPDSHGRRIVSKANEMAREVKFRFDDHGKLTATAVEASSRASVGDHFSPRRQHAVDDYGELILIAMQDLGEGISDLRWYLGEFVPRKASDRPENRRLDAIVNCLLDIMSDKKTWVRLLRGMTPQLQRRFLARMSRWGSVSRDNWPAVRLKHPFRFERSVGYAVILLMAFVVSAIALWTGGRILADGLGSFESFAALVACISIVGSWIWMRAASPALGAIAGISDLRFTEALFGPLAAAVELMDGLLDSPGVLVTVAATPACLWLAGSAIAEQTSIFVAIAILMGIFVFGTLLSIAGRRKERARMMPLAGFFADDAIGDGEVAVA